MVGLKSSKYYYGYVVAAVCFGIQAIGIGTFVSYGVFFSSLSTEFGWSRATISGASSLTFFLMGLLGIFVGRLNDRVGPRKMMVFTSFFFGLGFFLMSRINAVWQLYLFYGVVIGIGFSSIDVISLSTTARWFARKRGIMTGLVKVGTGAGQLTIPLAASLLITNYGWRTAYIVIGAAGMILLIAISQFLRRDPGQIGLQLDDEKDTPGDQAGFAAKDLLLSQALRTTQFWVICAVNLSVVFCLLIVMVHIVPHAQDMRVSAAKAAGVLATIGGVSMAGRFFTGIVIDRFGSRRAMMVCSFLLIVALLSLQIASELWMLYLFAAVYGIAHGGFFTTISPMVAEFFGIRAHGVLFGIVVFSGCTGGAIGPILAGYIFDVTGSYSSAFWLSSLVAILGFGLIISLQPKKMRGQA